MNRLIQPDLLVPDLHKPRYKMLLVVGLLGEIGVDAPVFHWHKRCNLAFSVHHKPQRRALDPARALAPGALPEEWADSITTQVGNTSCLFRLTWQSRTRL